MAAMVIMMGGMDTAVVVVMVDHMVVMVGKMEGMVIEAVLGTGVTALGRTSPHTK